MTVAYEELILEQGRTTVGGGTTPGTGVVFAAVRRFKVPGDTHNVVFSEVMAQTNPALDIRAGIPHPSLPGLVSLGFEIVGRGGAGDDVFHYVEANYAVAGTPTFDFPAPDRQRIGLVSAGFQQFDKQIDFPIYVRKSISAPGAAAPVTVDSWEKIENKSIIIKGVAFTIEFNTMTLGPPQLDAIFNQMNNIHQLFPGGGWLFKPQRADKIFREGMWNVVFRWEGERATGDDELAPFRADPKYCPVANRPPHAEWFVVWRAVGEPPNTSMVPHLEAHAPHATVPAGYEQLPGYGTEWNL